MNCYDCNNQGTTSPSRTQRTTRLVNPLAESGLDRHVIATVLRNR